MVVRGSEGSSEKKTSYLTRTTSENQNWLALETALGRGVRGHMAGRTFVNTLKNHQQRPIHQNAKLSPMPILPKSTPDSSRIELAPCSISAMQSKPCSLL
jgi:hypothetical protein